MSVSAGLAIKWVMGGGWRYLVGAAVIAVAVGGYMYHRHQIFEAGADSIRPALEQALADKRRAEAWREQFQADYRHAQAQAIELAASLEQSQASTNKRKTQILALANAGTGSDCVVPGDYIRLHNEAIADWRAAIGGRAGNDALQPAANADGS